MSLFFLIFEKELNLISHPQVIVFVTKQIKVDELLAPSIRKLNEMGIETLYSCQGGPPDMFGGYISFTAKKMPKSVRREVERILNFNSPVPVYHCKKNGELKVGKKSKIVLPYWEVWKKRKSCKWVIRFEKM